MCVFLRFVPRVFLRRAVAPLCIVTALFIRAADARGDDSRWVRVGQSGRLIYALDDRGDRIMDFSMVGYEGGTKPLPTYTEVVTPDRIKTVPAPGAVDQLSNIQATINEIAGLSLNDRGFRGVVQLSPGNYKISGSLSINSSGIILRGAGDGSDPATNTILTYTGTYTGMPTETPRIDMIHVNVVDGTLFGRSAIERMIDKVVPAGATSFRVNSIENWKIGDTIRVDRPSPQDWINAIGMDRIERPWGPNTKNQEYERTITYIDRDRQRVFLDAPLPNSFEQKYQDAASFNQASKITWERNRTNNVGIENIRGKWQPDSTSLDMKNSFVLMENTSNGWVRNVTGERLGFATVDISRTSRNVTVDNATSLEPSGPIAGGWRYPFNIDGQLNLMENLASDKGRHDFVNNSRARGPNVFLDGDATNSQSDSGPHQGWATGTLFDSLRTTHDINVQNRRVFDPEQGWAGANMVIWNSQASKFIVQNPPTAQNWLIGSTGLFDPGRYPPAYVDSHESPVTLGTATSLYRAQLNERMAHQREQRREYWLGDFDGYENGDADDQPEVDPKWREAAEELARTLVPPATITGFDGALSASNVIVPFTFNFDPPSGRISAATLTLAVHGGGFQPANDRIWIESTTDSIGFDQLRIEQFPTSKIVTLEFFPGTPGATLESLADGEFNVLVGNDHAVDWADLVFTSGSKELTWTGEPNGNWDVIATENWRDAALPEKFYNGDAVVFGNGPVNRTVNLTGTVLPAAVTVNNSAASNYTFSGLGSIGGAASLTKSGGGVMTLATLNTYTGTTTVNGGTLRVTGRIVTNNSVHVNAGAVFAIHGNGTAVGGITGDGATSIGAFGKISATNVRQGSLSINGLKAELVIRANGSDAGTSVVGMLDIGGGGVIDLRDNDLIVRATALTKDAVHAAVQADIVTAQNGVDAALITNWDGPGVTSSFARTANLATGFDLVGIGVIRNSDLDITTGLPGSSYASFSGQPVTPDDVLVKYTYIGDANLSGAVSFDDYVGIDNAFFGLIPNLGWATGDINFDGVINFDDYSKVDQAFFFQGAPLSHADVSAVPEPQTWLIALLAAFAGLFTFRRRNSPAALD